MVALGVAWLKSAVGVPSGSFLMGRGVPLRVAAWGVVKRQRRMMWVDFWALRVGSGEEMERVLASRVRVRPSKSVMVVGVAAGGPRSS